MKWYDRLSLYGCLIAVFALSLKNHFDQQVLVTDYDAVHDRVVKELTKNVKDFAPPPPEVDEKALQERVVALEATIKQFDPDGDGVPSGADRCEATKPFDDGRAPAVNRFGCSDDEVADSCGNASQDDKSKPAEEEQSWTFTTDCGKSDDADLGYTCTAKWSASEAKWTVFKDCHSFDTTATGG